jgi:hypothetical protein
MAVITTAAKSNPAGERTGAQLQRAAARQARRA